MSRDLSSDGLWPYLRPRPLWGRLGYDLRRLRPLLRLKLPPTTDIAPPVAPLFGLSWLCAPTGLLG